MADSNFVVKNSLTVNTVFVANPTTLTANGLAVNSTIGSFSGAVNSSSFATGNTTTGTGGFQANTTQIFVGNNTTNSFLTTSGLSINAATVANTLGVYTAIVNAATHSVGTTLVANASGLFVATGSVLSSTVNTTFVYATGSVNAATHTAGANVQFNANSIAWVGNTTTSPSISLANTGSFGIGNSSTTQTGSAISIANSTGNVQVTPGTSSINATGSINAASHTSGANFIANTSGVYTTTVNATTHSAGANVGFTSTSLLFTGNTTTSPTITLANTGAFTIGSAITTQTTSIISIANSTGNVQIASGTASINATGSVNAALYTVGTSLIANSTGLYTGIVNATSYTTGNGYGTIIGGATVNTTVIGVGNTTVNAFVNSSVLYIGGNIIANSTGANNAFYLNGQLGSAFINATGSYTISGTRTFTANIELRSGNLVINTTAGVIANGSIGAAGQALFSNGSSVYWGAITSGAVSAPGSNTYIVYNDNGALAATAGLIYNKTSNTITIGNTVTNASINSTSYTGTANNATNLNGVAGSSYAKSADVHYVGTTSIALNRASAAQSLTGITSIDGNANSATYIVANTGIVSNSVGVFVNATYISTLTANNASFVGSVSAANVVSNAQLVGNLSFYTTTANLPTFIGGSTANNTSFVGSVSAANVVSNAQLIANLANYQAALGFTPVQQGGGTDQFTNKVYIGWRTDSNLGLQIDATNFGNTWPISISGSAPYLGGVAAASYARLAGPTFTGTVTTSNLVTSNTVTVGTAAYHVANGNFGVGNTAPATRLQIDGNYGIKITTLSAGNNHNINCISGNYFVITCNSSTQNVYFTNAPANTAYGMIVKFANGNGGNTISFANTVKWPYGIQPTSSSNTDMYVFITDDGGTTWRGNITMKDSR